MRARLTIEVGASNPPVFDLTPPATVTLGRHRDNSIVLHDEHASRWHAEIAFADNAWRVQNIGAPLNGTRLDGRRIAGPTILEHGQEVGIGDSRLRFALLDQPPLPVVESPSLPETALLPDELTALCRFMAAAVEQTEARPLLARALDTLLTQTRATFAGFLSLDPDGPVAKMTAPEKAEVDHALSRQLTRSVQRLRRPVWLAQDQSSVESSDSLGPFTDAFCLPLRVVGADLGALHLYKGQGLFTERQLRFGEVLAGYLANSLHVLRSRRTLEAENSRLRGHAPADERLLGDSPPMRQLRDRIARTAARPVMVLIRGESGSGKELVALALHRQSDRCDGPLVAVNCAAIAATLPEAELFGHCKGAFTGADRDRPGLFQQADEGTLFLDEVGELPADCQAKLLRVIEGKGFRPVGATAETRVDVRIVAASNRDLEAEVKNGAFRQDLLFRLQVMQIVVPPLRDRADDIPELAASYLGRMAVEYRRPIKLTDEALKRLTAYSWPGNVRQLWAVLESAAIMTDGPLLDAADLPLPNDAAPATAPGLDLEALEDWAIRQSLRKTQGNVTQAAKLLGVVRDTLAAKMKRRGISREG